MVTENNIVHKLVFNIYRAMERDPETLQRSYDQIYQMEFKVIEIYRLMIIYDNYVMAKRYADSICEFTYRKPA